MGWVVFMATNLSYTDLWVAMDQTACQYDAEPVHSQSVHYHTDYFPLLELPPELLLRVCDFIDSTTVITQLGSVCKSLRELVNDDLIWKMRIRRRWPGKRYPPSFNSSRLTDTRLFFWIIFSSMQTIYRLVLWLFKFQRTLTGSRRACPEKTNIENGSRLQTPW